MMCRFLPLCLLCVLGGVCPAAEVTGDLGPLGEVTTWLIIEVPPLPLDADPFEPMGGEAVYAAMQDSNLAPSAGAPLEIPARDSGEKVRLGDGVWEATRMVSPDMPSIWNEYPRLVVPQNYGYAYCRLDSPQARKAGLVTGANRGQYRIYVNGRDLGTYKGGFAWEFARETPIDLVEGANHLLVRFTDNMNFACRLVGENAEPLREVKVTVQAANAKEVKAPEPSPLSEQQKLLSRAAAIPPPPPAEHPELLGANLARTIALLESGKYTHRPVRIVFSGQSIEMGWTNLLIQRLRERYPETTIVAENRAIGGWFVWRMQKLLKHDILRWQPDLVLFSAYQGTAEVWERLLAELRSETTADIIIRTPHLRPVKSLDELGETAETIMLRRLAQKYDAELIEVRNEWGAYLKAHNMEARELLRDGIHLNAGGEALMALLYERHFAPVGTGRQGWAKRVRRFDVDRFLTDHKADEIVLEGDGWTRHARGFASSTSAEDKLRLKFRGTRVDLVLPPSRGSATVLIDGKKPSEWNLFRGTRPQDRVSTNSAPNFPMTYHMGPGMQKEAWVLTLLEANVDDDPKRANRLVRFRLTGSKTGFDGEGRNDAKFVSNSGRITLLPADWYTMAEPRAADQPQPVMEALDPPREVVWHIRPTSRDVVSASAGWRQDTDYYSGQPYEYVTVADGLPCGIHELTLIPVEDADASNAFIIAGVDIHLPPLARDTSEQTTLATPQPSR